MLKEILLPDLGEGIDSADVEACSAGWATPCFERAQAADRCGCSRGELSYRADSLRTLS